MIQLDARKAGLWLSCAKRAAHEAVQEPVESKERVIGAVVGERVHTCLMGGSAPSLHTNPTAVLYDKSTPSEREASRQVVSMAEKAKNLMEENGLTIVDQRVMMSVKARAGLFKEQILVTSNVDFHVKDLEGREWLMQFNTGRYPPVSAWLESAVSCWLYAKLFPDKPLEGGAVMWVPRQRKAETAKIKPIFDVRAKADMLKLAEQVIRRVSGICASKDPEPTPSLSGCSSCALCDECPAVMVRMGGGTE